VVCQIYVIGFAEGVVDIIKQFNGDYFTGALGVRDIVPPCETLHTLHCFTGDLTFDVRIVGCATAVLIILMTKIGIEVRQKPHGCVG